jgi:hypothetical protein
MANVWVLTVDTGFGNFVYVCATEELGRARLAEYCREWWEDYCEDSAPTDNEAVIEAYFDAQDSIEGESWELDEYPVLEAVEAV